MHRVYYPANAIELKNGGDGKIEIHIVNRTFMRVYDYGEQSHPNITLALPAERCASFYDDKADNKNKTAHHEHVVFISFFKHWIPLELFGPHLILNRAFVLQKLRSNLATGFVYKMFEFRRSTKDNSIDDVLNQKSSEIPGGFVAVFKGYDMHHTNIYLRSTPIFKIDEERKYTMKNMDANYFAIFATHMDRCPTFISEASEALGVWRRGQKIPMVGRSLDHQPRITVLRDLLIACIAIICYYYALNSLILPLYFHVFMPLQGQHQPEGEAEQGHEGASEVEKAPEQADADKKATSPLAPQSNHSETKKKKS